MKNRSTCRFDLIQHLVWRDFTLCYKRSVLGILWSLLPPLSQLLVLVFLFRKVVPLNIEGYPAFVFTALLPWIWFSTCLNTAGGLFIYNRDLLRRPHFEPFNLIVVNTLANLINYLIFLPVLFLIMVFYGRPVTLSLVIVPLLLLIQGTLTAGLSMIIATLNVFYRDIQHLTNVALMLLFYLIPVFYQSETVGEKYRLLYSLNPLAVLIQDYRAVFFHGVVPHWTSLTFTMVAASLIFGLGYFIYDRKLSDMIDAI
jgi:ABC-type polysaccharide/polyol phosphate export permease